MAELTDNRILIHRIDDQDRIIFVNNDWLSFAMENGAPHLTESAVTGKSIWDFITGWPVKHLYLLLINRVRRTPELKVTIPVRCDSPTLRRFMELDVSSPGQGIVEFKTRIVRLERRDRAVLSPRPPQTPSGPLLMCSICSRVQTSNMEWLEIDEAIRRYELFSGGNLAQLSHGVCRSCKRSFLHLLVPLKKLYRRLRGKTD